MDLRLHLVQVCLLRMRETILWVNKGGSLFNIRGITFSPRPACPKIRTVHSRSHPVPPPTHPDALFWQDHLITEVPCTPTLGTFQSVLLVLRSSCHLARPQGQSGGRASVRSMRHLVTSWKPGRYTTEAVKIVPQETKTAPFQTQASEHNKRKEVTLHGSPTTLC